MWAHVQHNKMTSFQIHHQGHMHPLHACIKRRDNLQHIWLPHEMLGLLDNACHFLMLRLMLISSCSALAVSGLWGLLVGTSSTPWHVYPALCAETQQFRIELSQSEGLAAVHLVICMCANS